MSTLNIKMGRPPEKLRILYNQAEMAKYEYVILEGGRGGGKTETLGQMFVVNSMSDPGDILCLREIQNSINDSVYKVIVEWIEVLGLQKYFHITKTEIHNKQSGAKFLFKGMKGSAESSSIKSIKGIKYVWYEEAQTASKESIEMLDPTIREPGRRLYFSMNPDTVDDVVPNVIGKYSKTLRIQINYYDNQYCPQVLIDLANNCKEHFPHEYDHVWLGQPRGDGDRMTVLPFNMLLQCVDAHKTLGHDDGFAYAGLDLAPGEMKSNDKNALTVVRGPVVELSDDWRSGDMKAVAGRCKDVCENMDVARLYYDAVGVGGFAEKQLLAENPQFGVVPIMGQNSPHGPKHLYMRQHGAPKVLNKDFFKNLKAQSWWNLRLRAENTIRMLNGFNNVRPEYYLSFNPDIPDLQGLLREMAQATWKEDNSGRIIIDKTPGDYKVVINGKKVDMRSPNRADSVNSAFLRSCKHGLRANR